MSFVQPSWFAYLALLLWPIVTLFLYAKLPTGRATIWTVLGAFLLLPTGTIIKFGGVPGLDKESIPNFAALIGCAFCTGRLPRFFRGLGLIEVLFCLLLVGPFITSMLN